MCSSHSPIYIGAQIILYTYCIIKKIILTSVSLIDLQITNQIIEILHHQEHPFLSFLFAKRPISVSQTINFQVLLLCAFCSLWFFFILFCKGLLLLFLLDLFLNYMILIMINFYFRVITFPLLKHIILNEISYFLKFSPK
jgi:hypothetical protein